MPKLVDRKRSFLQIKRSFESKPAIPAFSGKGWFFYYISPWTH